MSEHAAASVLPERMVEMLGVGETRMILEWLVEVMKIFGPEEAALWT